MKIPDNKEIISFAKINQVAIIMIAVLIISFAFIFKAAIFPQAKKLISLNRELKAFIQPKESIETTKRKKSELENDIQELMDKYQRKEKILFASLKEELFLNDLAKLARIANIKIISIQPLSKIERKFPSSSNVYYEFPYKIRMGCGYHELGRFINQLEGNKELMIRINKIDISNRGVDIWEHEAELDISIFTKSF